MITDEKIIEAAYLAGFEPTNEELTFEQLLTEVQEYLISNQ